MGVDLPTCELDGELRAAHIGAIPGKDFWKEYDHGHKSTHQSSASSGGELQRIDRKSD
jgi:hypothetical protein